MSVVGDVVGDGPERCLHRVPEIKQSFSSRGSGEKRGCENKFHSLRMVRA